MTVSIINYVSVNFKIFIFCVDDIWYYFITAETYQSVASSHDFEISSVSDFQKELLDVFRLADFFLIPNISVSTDTQSQQAHSPSHYI